MISLSHDEYLLDKYVMMVFNLKWGWWALDVVYLVFNTINHFFNFLRRVNLPLLFYYLIFNTFIVEKAKLFSLEFGY